MQCESRQKVHEWCFGLTSWLFLRVRVSVIAAAISIQDAHLEKISYQAIVSHLENGSLWVFVDSNNSLNKKRTCLALVHIKIQF